MNFEYLKDSVGNYLCRSLCEVATRRPERPIEFLAYHLISLYEKDLEMQRIEQASSEDEDKKSSAEIPLTPVLSQMFKQRLSVSFSRQTLEDISTPVSPSPSTSVDEDIHDQATEKEIPITDEEVEQREIEQSKPSKSLSREIYTIPERKPSTINDPVTAEEEKEFGTSDPFLARRETKIFDVNFSPIGNN